MIEPLSRYEIGIRKVYRDPNFISDAVIIFVADSVI